MLAAVLHERHGLPAAQLSRLLDLNAASIKKHVDQLLPLFAEHGFPLAPTSYKIKKLEDLTAHLRLPQDRPTGQRHAK